MKSETGGAHVAAVEAMLAPSQATIEAAFESLADLTAQIETESQAVLETLGAVGEVLDAVRGSTDMQNPLGGLGAIALPLPIAMKAVMGPVSKYVKKKTGISFYDWVDLIHSTQAQFKAHIAQLHQVSQLSDRWATETLTMDQLRANAELLRETRARTALWSAGIGRLSQLAEVVDATLDGLSGRQSDGASGAFGSATGIVNRLKALADRWLDKLGGLRKSLQDLALSSVRDLRGRATELHEQTDRLTVGLADLGDLLDIQLGLVEARLQNLSGQHFELVGWRLASGVLVPRLIRQLETSRKRLDEYQRFQQRLEAAHQQGKTTDEVYAALSLEYQLELEAATARMQTLEAEADEWRAGGRSLFDAGLAWLEAETATTRIRQAVGQLADERANEQIVALQREMTRVQRALEDLNRLPAPRPLQFRSPQPRLARA